MKNVGFVGLGAMGAPMAANILAGGHRLAVGVHRSRKAADELGVGIEIHAGQNLLERDVGPRPASVRLRGLKTLAAMPVDERLGGRLHGLAKGGPDLLEDPLLSAHDRHSPG